MFLPSSFSDDEFLGVYKPPEQLVRSDFQSTNVPLFVNTIADSKITWRFFGSLLLKWKGDEAYAPTRWARYSSSPTGWTGASSSPATRCRVPAFCSRARPCAADDFYCARPGRPLLIVGGTISQKKRHEVYSPYRNIHLEITPLYVGSPVLFHYAGPDYLPVGGGYIEPFAYDSQAPRFRDADLYTVRLQREWHHLTNSRFTLADMMAVSGAAPSHYPIAGFFGFPEFEHWSPAYPTNFHSVEYLHADGGVLENTGIMPLLARRVSNIVVFVNSEKPFTPDYPEKGGVLSDSITALFGRSDNLDFSHQFNQVFETSGLADLVAALARKAAGDPLVHMAEYTVRPNPHYGMPSYPVRVCWLYLGPMRRQGSDRNRWIEALAQDRDGVGNVWTTSTSGATSRTSRTTRRLGRTSGATAISASSISRCGRSAPWPISPPGA